MILYLIMSNLTYFITQMDISAKMSKDIKSYRLGKKLLYPMNYITKEVMEAYAMIFLRILTIYVPVCLVVFLVTKASLPMGNLLLLAAVLFFATVLNFLFSFLVGICAFFVTETWGINAMKSFLIYTFSGAFFPFDILGERWQALIFATPFPYVSYYPSKILVDPNFTMSYGEILPAAVWIAVLAVVSFLLWRVGLRKYESCGA